MGNDLGSGLLASYEDALVNRIIPNELHKPLTPSLAAVQCQARQAYLDEQYGAGLCTACP